MKKNCVVFLVLAFFLVGTVYAAETVQYAKKGIITPFENLYGTPEITDMGYMFLRTANSKIVNLGYLNEETLLICYIDGERIVATGLKRIRDLIAKKTQSSSEIMIKEVRVQDIGIKPSRIEFQSHQYFVKNPKKTLNNCQRIEIN